MRSHWKIFGRNYYSRHDYEAIPTNEANTLISESQAKLPNLSGHVFAGETVSAADVFEYLDPVDGSISNNQGIRIYFESGGRVVFRLSGTGTDGATLRIYLEQYVAPDGDCSRDTQMALDSVRQASIEICKLTHHTNRTEPNVMT